MNFITFKFGNELQEGLEMMGFDKATPIQEQAIPIIQKERDLIACAQTGTGKTDAFVLPILDKLTKEYPSNKVKAIIIAPTRELAKQIDMQIEGFSYFTNSSSYPIYGGGTGVEFDNQKEALKKGADIIICTPGRLLAHLDFNYFDTSGVEHLILDEADRMLDMGFHDDIMSIAKQLPEKRQTLLFSATMPNGIKKIVHEHMNHTAHRISISRGNEVNANIEHKFILCDDSEKFYALLQFLNSAKNQRGIIFCRTRTSAKKIATQLKTKNIAANAIHGDLLQKERDKVMRAFKKENLRVIVATDITARGIDISNLAFVVNYQLPDKDEYYTHRSGRTARAGKKGMSLVLANSYDIRKIRGYEERLKISFSKL